jgi:hypothetical protein
MPKPPDNSDLIEACWQIPINLRVKILILSLVQANSKDTFAIINSFLNIISNMARLHRPSTRLALANQLRACAGEIEQSITAVKHET